MGYCFFTGKRLLSSYKHNNNDTKGGKRLTIMKNLYKQKREQGFTIIEVLIVLAIAALILLIVFLAVPALQRNSRNNAIRNDAARLIAGVNDYIANNNGAFPAAADPAAGSGTGTITIGVAPATTSEVKTQPGTIVRLRTTSTAATQLGEVVIHMGFKCNGTAPTTVSPRAVSASFQIETTSSGTGSPQCLES